MSASHIADGRNASSQAVLRVLEHQQGRPRPLACQSAIRGTIHGQMYMAIDQPWQDKAPAQIQRGEMLVFLCLPLCRISYEVNVPASNDEYCILSRRTACTVDQGHVFQHDGGSHVALLLPGASRASLRLTPAFSQAYH